MCIIYDSICRNWRETSVCWTLASPAGVWDGQCCPSLEICQVTSTLCGHRVPLYWVWKWAETWSYLKTAALSVALLVLISFQLAAISWEHPVTSTWIFFGTRHHVLCKVSCKWQLYPVPWMKQEVTKMSWIFDVRGIALASWLRLFCITLFWDSLLP